MSDCLTPPRALNFLLCAVKLKIKRRIRKPSPSCVPCSKLVYRHPSMCSILAFKGVYWAAQKVYCKPNLTGPIATSQNSKNTQDT